MAMVLRFMCFSYKQASQNRKSACMSLKLIVYSDAPMSHLKKVMVKTSNSNPPPRVILSAGDREQLRLWRRKADKTIPIAMRARLAMRACAILLLADNRADRRLRIIASKVELSSATVMRLRDQVMERGLATLVQSLRHGRRIDPRVRANLKAERLMRVTYNKLDGSTTRALAEKYGVSQSTAARWIRQR